MGRVININSKKIASCIFIFLFSLDVAATEKEKFFSIAKDLKSRDTVIASLIVENPFTGIDLESVDNNNSNSLNALAYYYALGKANDTLKLIELYNSSDGSKYWIKDQLDSIPDKFEGFKNLFKVEALNHVYWGPYDIFIVDWFKTSSRRLLSWYDAVFCSENNRCYMSSILMEDSHNTEIFTSVVTLAQRGEIKNAENLSNEISIYPDNSIESAVNPLVISFDIDWLDNPIELRRESRIINLIEDDGKLSHLNYFLNYVWDSHDKDKFNLAVDPSFNSVMNESWLNFNSSSHYPVVNLHKGTVKFYTFHAYSQHLGKIKSYKIHGYLDAESERYIIGSFVEDSIEKLLIIPVDNVSSKLISSTDNYTLNKIVYSKLFYEKLTHILSLRNNHRKK